MTFASSFVRNAVRDILRPTVKSLAGVSVRYHSRVSGLVYEVCATLANTEAQHENLEGLSFTDQLQDFKINVEDLPIKPQAKDTIEWQQYPNADPLWFQVLPQAGSREVEANDNYYIAWIVHTKNIPAPEVTTILYGDRNGANYGDLNDEGYRGP